PCCSSRSQTSIHSVPPTSEIYTLSLHDALPISAEVTEAAFLAALDVAGDHADIVAERLAALHKDRAVGVEGALCLVDVDARHHRSEEHTSELQSRENLVCRLLLEKKKICL